MRRINTRHRLWAQNLAAKRRLEAGWLNQSALKNILTIFCGMYYALYLLC